MRGHAANRDPSRRPQKASELAHRGGLVWEGTERALAERTVSGLVWEGKRFGVALDDPHARGQSGLRGREGLHLFLGNLALAGKANEPPFELGDCPCELLSRRHSVWPFTLCGPSH